MIEDLQMLIELLLVSLLFVCLFVCYLFLQQLVRNCFVIVCFSAYEDAAHIPQTATRTHS